MASNCTLEEFEERRRELATAILNGTKAPERNFEPLLSRAVTDCIHAGDTGVKAFVNLPCRGNRIVCRRVDGLTTFAAACQPEKCKYYTNQQKGK